MHSQEMANVIEIVFLERATYIIVLLFTTLEWFIQTIVYSECLLHLSVLRVFVLFNVFVCVRAILSWCP